MCGAGVIVMRCVVWLGVWSVVGVVGVKVVCCGWCMCEWCILCVVYVWV